MGRRKRRKQIKLPKKKLPTIFHCPLCGLESVNVNIRRGESGEKIAVVRCGSCGASKSFPFSPIYKPVDIYCKFVDALAEQA